jgi:NAD(P)-dependent dehydrogenase (short-subunit alcohol dehydrogenase family)
MQMTPPSQSPSHPVVPRVAAITGGASGLGEAAAHRLARDGMAVAILDIDPERVKAVAGAIVALGGEALPVVVDVCSAESVDLAFSAVEAWNRPADILVNSAGLMNVVSLMDCSPDQWERVMSVNVTGSFLCAQRAARGMIAQRYGRIVNITSVSAARAGVGRVAYGTSKAAVAGLTRQLAMELGRHGITANSVAPGPVMTPMTALAFNSQTQGVYTAMIPAGRFGLVEEIADAIAFLASPGSAYINGVMLPVDGGYLAAGVATTGDVTAS